VDDVDDETEAPAPTVSAEPLSRPADRPTTAAATAPATTEAAVAQGPASVTDTAETATVPESRIEAEDFEDFEDFDELEDFEPQADRASRPAVAAGGESS